VGADKAQVAERATKTRPPELQMSIRTERRRWLTSKGARTASQVRLLGAALIVAGLFATTTTHAGAAFGEVATLAGSTNGYADGAGPAAQFSGPYNLSVGPDDRIWVTDWFNRRFRVITSAGVVSTAAGNGNWNDYADGPALSAGFSDPRSIVVAADGTVYIADSQNRRLRRLSTTGTVSTVAGSGGYGSVDGTGTSAQFTELFAATINRSTGMV
jgi:streptogramin lyase